MGGIVGQADQYACFDNTPRPERVAREAPSQEIISEFTRGRRVGAGQNNPRDIRQHAGLGEGPAVPESYWHDDSHDEEERFYDQMFGPGREPPIDEGYLHEPHTPLQPLDDMLEHHRRPPPRRPPPEYFGSRSRLGFNEASRRLADGEMDFSGGDFSGGGGFGGDFGADPIANNLFTYMFRTLPPSAWSQILGT